LIIEACVASLRADIWRRRRATRDASGPRVPFQKM
jgi:hypothetical protein